MADLISMLAACAGGGEKDPDFNQTVLLLHGDGTNGAQNNTFLDSSTNNFTITRNGNTTQGTFSPFSVGAGEWSNYFDGTGDYLSIPYNSALVFDSGDFTIDCWFYLSGNAAQNGSGDRAAQLSSCIGAGPSAGWDLIIAGNSTTTGTALNFANRINNTTVYVITGSATVTQNQWNHVAVVRSGTTTTIYLNGTSIGSGTLTNQSITSAQPLWIGRQNVTNFTHDFPGYISNFRIVKGTAVYTSAFTPPIAPLTAITNTSLLTCQSNRFVDNSTNAFAITRNGDVRVTPFSPFAPTAAYSAGTNGGSGYFDGTGDWLTPPNDVALDLTSGDFTVSFWIYRLNDSRKEVWFTPKGFTVYFDSGSYIWTGSTALSIGTVNINSWNHIQVVKSGSTLYSFVNGVVTNHGTRTLNNGAAPQIGAEANASPFTGYISGLRVVKGTALNTTSFTPPTEPPTAITNTSLLLNFTNAGIFDNTGKNNLETVGNAQIDTTTKKFGTGSMEFDGSGDWLFGRRDWDIGANENFTIEAWIYLTAPQNIFIIVSEQDSTVNNSKYLTLNATGVEIQLGTLAATVATCTFSFSQNTWYHLAVVRSNNTISMYVDGVSKSVNQASQSGAFLDKGSVLYVGRWGGTTPYAFNGFIDDLRITKGVARYTAAFTPPTAAFPNE